MFCAVFAFEKPKMRRVVVKYMYAEKVRFSVR